MCFEALKDLLFTHPSSSEVFGNGVGDFLSGIILERNEESKSNEPYYVPYGGESQYNSGKLTLAAPPQTLGSETL
jgi:hypothetical protein